MKPYYMQVLSELTELDGFHSRAYMDERSRWYWRQTAEFLEHHVRKNAMILDAGCGYATLGLELIERGFKGICSMDKNHEKVIIAKSLYEKLDVSQFRIFTGDIFAMGTTWGAVIAMEVLYDLNRPLKELFPLIKNNLERTGYFIFTEIVWEKNPKPGRQYMSINDVIQNVEANGMRVEEFHVRNIKDFNQNVWYACQRES